MKYVCDLCGYVYDEVTGDPHQGIPAGTAFRKLPEDFECPDCGCGKNGFLTASGGMAVEFSAPDRRYDSQR